MSKKTKSVAFNMDDPREVELMEFIGQYPNFSGYVKGLILSDKNRREHAAEVIKLSGGGIKLGIKEPPLFKLLIFKTLNYLLI